MKIASQAFKQFNKDLGLSVIQSRKERKMRKYQITNWRYKKGNIDMDRL